MAEQANSETGDSNKQRIPSESVPSVDLDDAHPRIALTDIYEMTMLMKCFTVLFMVSLNW